MSSLNLPKPRLVMSDCQLLGRLRQEDGSSKVSLRKLMLQNKKQKEDWGRNTMTRGLPGMCEALGSSPTTDTGTLLRRVTEIQLLYVTAL